VQSLLLITSGRFDEAMAATRRARALDPLSPFINLGAAWVHHFAGRDQEVVHELLDVLALRPGLEEAGNILIGAYENLGRYEEAAALMARQPFWRLSIDAAALLAAWRDGGEAAYWRERLDQMKRQPDLPPTLSFALAIAHARVGELEPAMDHVERMIEHHVGGCVFVGVDPGLARMRGLARFDGLLRRVGMPQSQMV
jgi:tetratricopeptide (TPR) repeat protein